VSWQPYFLETKAIYFSRNEFLNFRGNLNETETESWYTLVHLAKTNLNSGRKGPPRRTFEGDYDDYSSGNLKH
jgi:hypothetical protein